MVKPQAHLKFFFFILSLGTKQFSFFKKFVLTLNLEHTLKICHKKSHSHLLGIYFQNKQKSSDKSMKWLLHIVLSLVKFNAWPK